MPAKEKIKLIFIGDIVAKPGRRAVAEILPVWRKKYNPDVVIGNVENLAHGKGVTTKTLTELREAGVDYYTGGNHIWSKEDPASPEIKNSFQIALPANVEKTPEDQKWLEIKIGNRSLFVVNLLGREGINFEGTDNPFLAFDNLYERLGRPKLLVLDFHGEITSEKVAAGWYFDGRASAVLGSHTHIPTADAKILPQGTGYITDVGMTGINDGVLGVQKEIIIDRFLDKEKTAFVWADEGEKIVTGVYLELGVKTGHCLKIKLLSEIIHNL